jgi:hypothetical protein
MSVVTDRRHRVTRVDHEQQQGKIKKIIHNGGQIITANMTSSD